MKVIEQTEGQLITELDELRQQFADLQRKHEATTEQLKIIQESARDIIDSSLDMIVAVDGNREIIEFNKAAQERFGYSKNEIMGQDIGILYDSPSDGLKINKSIKKSGGFVGEVVNKCKDGERFPSILSASILRDTDGKPMGVMGISRDITQQKQVEAELESYRHHLEELVEDRTAAILRINDELQREITEREQTEQILRKSEARNRGIVNTIPDLVLCIDADGTFLDYKHSRNISSYMPISNFSGKKISEVMPTEIAQQIMGGIKLAMQKGAVQVIEYTLLINDEARHYECRIIASEKTNVLAIVRDVTEREKADLMKNEFVSTVSHELRTPLTSIHASLGLILGGAAGELPSRLKELMGIAYGNSEQLVNLINDVLSIEKLESGKMELNLSVMELIPLVEHAIEANSAYAEQFGTKIILGSVLPDVEVNVDSDRLMQVFANLLSNAAKFSPPNDVILVSVTQLNEMIRIAIKDNGSGIPNSFRERIFQKFAQADSSDARQKNGTGLGLSIAKAIVEMHGGQIGFETELNTGTTFYFDLLEYSE